MDFAPRHAQPFTLQEAIQLDPPIIADEIARLQNSLKHLKETQELLREHMRESGEHDADVEDAARENEQTIGSQEERVTMLKLALVEKGVILPSSHYTLPGENPSAVNSQATATQATVIANSPSTRQRVLNEGSDVQTDDEGGITL